MAKSPSVREKPAHIPERIGRYEVLLPIASGGMATVYLARIRGVGGFERDIALKLTHSHLMESPEFALDLVEEAKLAARIRHPNVVTTLDVGEDPRGLYLVMEYVEGDSMAGLRRRAEAAKSRVPLRISLRFLLDGLAGLHAAHELRDRDGSLLNVVHRDFSPQNVLVGTDGLGRLSDFGVAKAVTRLGHTGTGLIKGKLAYMAPEQARATPLDRRCDVWAAGVIAWELLAGQRLYKTGNDVATLLKLVTETPPRLREVAPQVSPAFEEAVGYALTPNRDERCPTAAEFAQALREASATAEGLADREECAAYVAQMVGPKLDQRRTRVEELWELREKVGELSREDSDGSLPAAASDLRAPVFAISVQGSPNDSGASVRRPAPELVGETEEPADEPTEAITRIAARASTPSAHPEHTGTDTTSVSGAEEALARAAGRPRMRRVWIVAAAIVVPVVAIVGFVSFGRDDSEESLADLNATASSSPAEIAQSPPSASAPAATSTSTAALVASAFPLVVKANVPIATLRIDGRETKVKSPTRSVSLEVTEHEKGERVRVEARAKDGRRAQAFVVVGDDEVVLKFGTNSLGRPRPPATRFPEPGSPIPASPYKKGPR